MVVILIFEMNILNAQKKRLINNTDKTIINYTSQKCYIPSSNKFAKIIHLIFTRFIMELKLDYNSSFNKNIYKKKIYFKWNQSHEEIFIIFFGESIL